MALCGGLTIGVDNMEPYTPPLLMVKVPPVSSSIRQAVVLGLFGKVTYLPLDLGKAEFLGTAQDRNHQPLAAADGHSDIAVIMVDDVTAVDGSVYQRKILQAGNRRPDKKGHESQPYPVFVGEFLTDLLARPFHLRHVRFIEGGQQCHGLFGFQESCRYGSANGAHMDAALFLFGSLIVLLA